jgi:hypothetical protein
MIRAVVFAVVAAALLAACGESKSYPIAAAEVTSKLLSTRPPKGVFGSTATDVMVTQGDGGTVRWTVLKGGSQVMRLVATITPDGDAASRVAVSVEPPNNDANSAIGKNMADNPAVVKLYKAAMAEQIDARLTNREFNFTAIQGQMVAAAMATMPKMQASLDEAVKSSRDMERDREQGQKDAAYAAEHRAAMNGYSNDNSGGSGSDY